MQAFFRLIIFSFIFCCYNIVLCSIQDLHASTLGVIIMVKDEVDVIEQTLEPFIKAGIDTFLVYDTGSKDGTPEQVRAYFKNNNIHHGYIIEEPFIDFGTSRNRLLEHAENLFPQVAFFVMLDAEWYTHNVQDLLLFCEQHKDITDQITDGSCYTIKLITIQDNIDNYVIRLMRNGYNVRYEGVVHETITKRPSGCVPSVFFEYNPKECGKEKSCKRWERDYHLLKKSASENATNGRALFYLAQTCQFLDRWEEAIMYYKKRADLADISQESYLALYRIGCAIEYLLYNPHAPKKQNNYSWEDALYYYFAAYAMLPHRAEPLVRIATYYIYRKQYALAYLFAHRAALLPYPEQDLLFVEKQVYNFSRYDILGQCAFYMGEYEEGKNAVLNAIKDNPNATHLYHNLAMYLQNLII